MKDKEALDVWETFKRYPGGISKTKAARLTGLPTGLVELIIDKLLGMGLLEYRWIGYDRYYAVGDFFNEWEFPDEEDDVVDA